MSTLEKRLFNLILLLTIAGGIAMRIAELGAHPFGLYQDEAINGLDALAVWDSHLPLYFEANNGREPFFIYLMAMTIRLFGRNATGLRAAAAIAGILTLPATYILGRMWANRRVGLMSAAILAGMLWHVHLSRVGFRAVTLPLWTAIALGLGALALRRESRWWAIGAGAVYGTSFYTYSPARFTPLALILMLAYGLIWHRDYVIARWRRLGLMLAVGVAVALPLGILTFSQPDLVLGRSGQVAIWNESVNGGRFAATLLQSALSTLGMFVWRGDDIWRHNVPLRPVFDPLMAVVFLTGIVFAVRRWRDRPAMPLALIWTACLSLPTLLAEDAPHFLRGVGVLPLVALIPVMALDEVIERPGGEGMRLTGIAASLFILLVGLLTAFDYFGCRTSALPLPGYTYESCYRDDPVRGYFFQAEATQLAEAINQAEGTVYVDRRFWDTFPSIRFLAGNRSDIILFDEGESLTESAPPLTLFVWPHEDYRPTLNAIPAGAAVEIEPGPFTRGDLEPETYRLYVAFYAREAESTPESIVRFANGFSLTDLRVALNREGVDISLGWTLDEPSPPDAHVFVHIVSEDGQTILAQADEPPGTVYYPPLSWLAGSVIIQRISLAGSWPADAGYSARLGLYDPVTNERFEIKEASDPYENDAIIIPLTGDRIETE